ncbi:MAG: M42 family metallopeptidase [SAR202 cluster bacterium]|jgi:endoglucanase|nr:M42 family metallopeptidase [SAR202 cluster bacterium]MDP6514950.1 M42 family metallopeptidase [SAR202 cluster bacterium]MDP6714848.1 M42 family metallopeptidase [SAR202 cluster bacterium]
MTVDTKILEELTNAHGPSGFEGPVRDIMRRELEPLSDRIEVDGIGSLIASKDGASNSPRIMLAAHMDEVGLMVKYVTDDGYVKFQALGGLLDSALIGQRWVILTHKGPVHAVTGMKTVHVMTPEERSAGFKRDDIFLDAGATSKEDAASRLGIRPGDPIAPDSKFEALNGSDYLLGKAWDDRIGLAVMIEVMRSVQESPIQGTLYAVSTVQEEVGLRGAQTSSYIVKPDIGINIESGVAADYPGITQDEAQERLGSGPGVFLHDTTMLPNLKLRDLVIDVAEENDIPLQFEVLAGYGEDGAEMQRSFGGAPVVNISVPVRYLHTHNGIIHRRDIDQTIELVSKLVQKLDQATVDGVRSF